MRRVPRLLVALVLGFAGCQLDEVVVSGGESVVVVQAVMRPDLPQQFVVVERSFDGVSDPPTKLTSVPATEPHLPVVGARVTVANLDFPADPCGGVVLFDRDALDPLLRRRAGVYWGPLGCPTMRVGDRLRLVVETVEGEVVTGVTRVPGLSEATLAVAGREVPFGADTVEFNRDRDTLEIVVDAAQHRSVQLLVRRTGTAPPGYELSQPGVSSHPSLEVFIDSSRVRLPGDVLNVFEGGTGEETFLGGRRYTLVAGVADSNYFDFVRSGNNDYTGRGFVNHLQGGIGVFGSLVAETQVLEVVADAEDAREGTYRMRGVAGGVDVNVALSVYLARPLVASDFSAFFDGAWMQRGAAGFVPYVVERQSVDGSLAGDSLRLIVLTLVPGMRGPPSFRRIVMTGVLAPQDSFAVEVADSTVTSTQRIGTLVVRRQ